MALSVGRLGRCGRASTEALWRKLPTRRRRESDCSWLVDARCWLPSRESATTPTARPVGSNNWRVSSGPGLSLRPTGPHATARHTTEHPPPPCPRYQKPTKINTVTASHTSVSCFTLHRICQLPAVAVEFGAAVPLDECVLQPKWKCLRRRRNAVAEDNGQGD